jgi:hypothetical protein
MENKILKRDCGAVMPTQVNKLQLSVKIAQHHLTFFNLVAISNPPVLNPSWDIRKKCKEVKSIR